MSADYLSQAVADRHFSHAEPLRCRCGAVEPEPGDFRRCEDCEHAGHDTVVCGTCQFSYVDEYSVRCQACQEQAEDRQAQS